MIKRKQKAYDAARKAAYYVSNRARIQAYAAAYRASHRNQIQAYAAAYRATEKYRLYRVKYHTTEKYILTTAKYRAKKEGVTFNLCAKDITIPELCPIFGFPLVAGVSSTAGTRNSPSLDRIIPEKGYVKGNVWVISQRANRIKNDATWQELAQISEAVRKKIEEAKALEVD